MPANLANRLSPGLGAEGSITGTAKVTGAASRPAIDFNLAWTGAAVSQTRSIGLAPFEVKAKGSFVDQKLTLNTNLSGDAGLALAVQGSITLMPSPTMNLKVGGQVPFALAKTQLAAAGLSLEGVAKLDLTVTGIPTCTCHCWRDLHTEWKACRCSAQSGGQCLGLDTDADRSACHYFQFFGPIGNRRNHWLDRQCRNRSRIRFSGRSGDQIRRMRATQTGACFRPA